MPELEVENVAAVGGTGTEQETHGSESHPDTYTIPGVTAERADTPAPASTAPASTTAPGEVGGTPAGGQAEAPGEAFIPKYRLDETISRASRAEQAVLTQHQLLTEQRQQIATMQAMVHRLMSGGQSGVQPQGETPAAPQLSEADQRIVDRFYALFPQFKQLERLLPHTDDLLRVTGEVVPAIQRNTAAQWERVGHHMYGQVDEGVARLFLGEGKTGKDLDAASQQRYRNDFYAWLRSDQSRQQRYANLDSTLIRDYVSELEHTYVAPVRARFGVNTQQRAATTAALPQQGGGGAPIVARPPSAKNPTDEDAAHKAAWAAVQALKSA